MAIKQVPVIDAAEATQQINYHEESDGSLTQTVRLAGGTVAFEHSLADAPSYTRSDVGEFNSMSMMVALGEASSFYVRARTAAGGAAQPWEYLRPTNLAGGIAPAAVIASGLYHYDLRGVQEILIARGGSAHTGTIHGLLSTALPPPIATENLEFGRNRFRRIDASTESPSTVNGRFYAIKALSDDVTLHPNIRFEVRYPGDSEPRYAGFTVTDRLAQGDILYGPFDSIRINSGVVLAYYADFGFGGVSN